MMKLGKNIILGECNGYLQVFDIEYLEITHTQQFEEIDDIYDMIAIDDSEQLLLAGYKGVLKATKDQAIKYYFKGKSAQTLCHIAESLYFVGFHKDGFVVWNYQTDQQLFQVSSDSVWSIKRILNTNSYIIKTNENRLK